MQILRYVSASIANKPFSFYIDFGLFKSRVI